VELICHDFGRGLGYSFCIHEGVTLHIFNNKGMFDEVVMSCWMSQHSMVLLKVSNV